MKQELQNINFHGSNLLTIEQGGTLYVAMKPVCESIGVNWDSQRKKVMGHSVLSSVAVIMTATGNDGKQYKMVMLPIKYIQGWLFMIDANRVKPEIKELLLRYQRECYRVLANHFRQEPMVTDDAIAKLSQVRAVGLAVAQLAEELKSANERLTQIIN